ncbi:MAG: ABC transporter permease subunit [Oscillospiraceae bacterium]
MASPLSVLKKLGELFQTKGFYLAVLFSLTRITLGFVCAAAVGCALGALAYKSELARVLLRPFMAVVKATPVASFIILALIMTGSENLSALISFLMVLPVFYSNILSGLSSVEPERFEAAEVFGMARGDRFRFIFMPYVTPYFSSACSIGLGMAWKSGVAAEVIGLAAGSMGEKLYEAKIYLDTAELFAYTTIIILISLLLERFSLRLVRAAEASLLKNRYI